jgi:hypothetical protein
MSSENWSAWVTEQRRDYSRRQSMRERLTNASECLSWPTASARDSKGGYQGGRIRNGKLSMDTLDVAVQAYREGGILGPPVRAKSSTGGSRLASSWATPQSRDYKSPEGRQDRWGNPKRSRNLNDQMKAWATPTVMDSIGARNATSSRPKNSKHHAGTTLCDQTLPTKNGKVVGGVRLSPRWVEVLMGLPVGWVMPSCKSPAIVEPMNSGSSAMALCPSALPSPSVLCSTK